MKSHGKHSRYRSHRRPHRKKHSRQRRPEPYRVREFVGAYLLAVLGVSAALSFSPALGVISYFVFGIGLSRYISERVEWWEFSANIHNVAAVKLHTIYSWPVSVPIFIFQVFIAKFL